MCGVNASKNGKINLILSHGAYRSYSILGFPAPFARHQPTSPCLQLWSSGNADWSQNVSKIQLPTALYIPKPYMRRYQTHRIVLSHLSHPNVAVQRHLCVEPTQWNSWNLHSKIAGIYGCSSPNISIFWE